ncbi:MAG TPA: AAA family ATPase [Solirubrobacteraceae bacterium]|nr:AAA family ATPase [Solirubrobacteraceae bacterium]
MPKHGGVDGEYALMLPRIERMELRHFSLYKRRRVVEVDFDRPVFCLAGANGLGKSTFLATLGYAITGTVPRPDLSFLRSQDFYADSREYSTRCFEGRISSADHELAEVELEMTVASSRFKLVRGMFEPLGLRSLMVERDGEVTIDLRGPQTSESQRHECYVESILEATGLEAFEQLVFLQLIVLTFDESHRLLFWSQRATELALFLAFGIPPKRVAQAEALQHAYDSAESKARSLQWQATGARKRLEDLQKVLAENSQDGTDDEAVQEEHERLSNARDRIDEEHLRLTGVVDEAELKVDEALAAQVSAGRAYREAYDGRVRSSTLVHQHPIVNYALQEHRCELCGTHSEQVSASVRGRLDEAQCPLCSSPIDVSTEEEQPELRELLRKLGELLVASEKAQKDAEAHLSRQRQKLNEVDQQLRSVSRELDNFKTANTRSLLRTEGHSEPNDAQVGMQREIDHLLTEKDEEVQRRDKAQAQLNKVRDDLTSRFVRMEREFVPLLQELAEEFLGMPLQVDLERRGHHVGLRLTFDGSERASPDALSESQRYFMDIALRMALAQKLSRSLYPATLYVDTPEGSLDISYESRAGSMFGRFAKDNLLVMTANINTSRLLVNLAQVCRREGMELVRMTEWTELSDVQQESEGLFEEAYGQIERRLDGGDEH